MSLVNCILAAAALLAVAALAEAQAPAPPFRVAIVGLVHGHVDGFLGKYGKRDDVQVVGIAEPDAALGKRYADRYHLDPSVLFTDEETMLTSTHPQAVLVYTNTFGHRRAVETAIRHGLPVMMEKPLATTMEDARAIVKASKDANVPVVVNYFTTWVSSNQAVYDVAHDHSLGEIRKIVARNGHRGPKEIGVGGPFLEWLTDPKLNGAGALFDFGCYGADLATWILDDQRPLTVTAVTQQMKPDVYPNVDDDSTIILTYPKAQVTIQGSWNWPFERSDLDVYGASGTVMTAGSDSVRVHRPRTHEEVTPAKPLTAPYDDEMDYLRAVVSGAIKPTGPSALDTNLIVMEILNAARTSARTGKTVKL